MFEEAAVAVKEELVRQSKGGLTYLAEISGGSLSSSMDHLACFAGGMFALAGGSWLELAEEITRTCHQASLQHSHWSGSIQILSSHWSSHCYRWTCTERIYYYKCYGGILSFASAT